MRRGGGRRRALIWAAVTLFLPAPAVGTPALLPLLLLLLPPPPLLLAGPIHHRASVCDAYLSCQLTSTGQVTFTVTGWAAVRQPPAIASFRRRGATTAGGLWSGRTLAVGVALLARRAVSVRAPLPCPAGALRMSDVASLPIDPEAGSLADKIPAELDRSRLRHVSSVPAGMTPAVLVACGSYSPPTVLHTRIFETARDFFKENQELLKVDVIGGFVSPVHAAYGKKGLAPMEDRLAMVKLALESSDWVSCDDWETRQNEWTRTRLSLDRMHIEVNKGNGGGKEVQVMLLCGADILDSMVTPGVWMESDLHGE